MQTKYTLGSNTQKLVYGWNNEAMLYRDTD